MRTPRVECSSLTVMCLLLSSALAAGAEPRCVQLIGTNDFHGHLLAETRKAESKKVQQGGLSTFGGYVSILRKKFPGEVVLLDAGDLLHGTLGSNANEGASVVAGYNQLGYAAVAVGNHEFDFGSGAHPGDPTAVLQARMAEASFPFLSSNVFEKKTGHRPPWKNFAASTMVAANGIKIGIIGATTQSTPITTEPVNVASLDFRDPAPSIVEESKRLKKLGAEIIVLLAHIGGRCEDNSNSTDVSSCEKHTELFDLIDRLPPFTVDAAIAGHSHANVAHFYRQVAVSEAGAYGQEFGWITACRQPDGAVEARTVTVKKLIPICASEWAEGGCDARASSQGASPATFLGEPVVPDPNVEKTLQPFLSKVKAKSDEPLGVSLAQPLERVRTQATGLGMLVSEAMRRAVPGAQIGFTNPGGLRGSLPAGPLRFGQLFEVLPFDDHLVRLKMKGAQLERFILSLHQSGFGVPQLSGAKVVLEPSPARLVLANGAALKPEQEYVLATNDFLANGGDGTAAVVAELKADQRADTDGQVRDAVIAYLRSLPQPVQTPIP